MKKKRMTLAELAVTPAAKLNRDLLAKYIPTEEKKRAKYGNEKVEVDGFVVDSKKEAKRLRELRYRLKKGEIAYLARQVEFPLSINGEHVASYFADFVYNLTSDGSRVVEDVKSEATRKLPVYRLKRRMMLAQHKITIIEV